MKNMAAIGYTQFYSDVRVVRETQAAVEAGFNVDVFSLKEEAGKAYRGIHVITNPRSQYKGSSKVSFVLSYVHFFFFCFWRVTSAHLKKKYDVIHINNMPNFLVFSCIIPKLLGAKIILDIHDLVPELFAEKFELPLDSFVIQMLYFEERLSGNFADVVISTNRLITQRLIKNRIRKRIFPEVLNAADEKIFTPFIRNNFLTPEIIVIFPSTIAKRLGLDILLDAFKIISLKKQNIKLKIFGHGEYQEKLKSRISEEQLQHVVSYCGKISFEQLNLELERAHIGVIPWPDGYSTNFQMPVKIHEFFIKGLCVICSDVKIIKEYFADRVAFFKAGNANELANKILHLAENPALMATLASKGHAFSQLHPWSKYKRLYQELILDEKAPNNFNRDERKPAATPEY